MSDRTFSTRGRFPLGALLSLGLALLFVTLALVSREKILFACAIWPGLLAFFLWRAASQTTVFALTPSSLELQRPAGVVPYEQMRGVWRRNRGKRSDRLYVSSTNAIVEIPPVAGISLDDLEGWLLENLPPRPQPAPHPEMEAFVQEQIGLFSADKVSIYRARSITSHKLIGRRLSRGLAWSYSFLVASPVLIALGVVNQGKWVAVSGFGVISLLVGMLLWLVFKPKPQAGQAAVPFKLRDSCLVLSPAGVALIQGDLRGTLAWEEVLGVNLIEQHRSFFISSLAAGLALKVRGADVMILSIYDSPLGVIEAEVLRNLHGS